MMRLVDDRYASGVPRGLYRLSAWRTGAAHALRPGAKRAQRRRSRKNHVVEGSVCARQGGTQGPARAKHHHRLVARGHKVGARCERCRAPALPCSVEHLQPLIERLQGDPVARRLEMNALPRQHDPRRQGCVAGTGKEGRHGQQTLRRRPDHEIFDGAADPQMHLPQERIDRAERAIVIEVHVDRTVTEPKLPGRGRPGAARPARIARARRARPRRKSRPRSGETSDAWSTAGAPRAIPRSCSRPS